jgi:hypothetical protein
MLLAVRKRKWTMDDKRQQDKLKTWNSWRCRMRTGRHSLTRMVQKAEYLLESVSTADEPSAQALGKKAASLLECRRPGARIFLNQYFEAYIVLRDSAF